MISRVSIIGTFEDGNTKIACISIKGRRMKFSDTKVLGERQYKYIAPYRNEFVSLKIISELQTYKKGKVYKVCTVIKENDNLVEELISMLNVSDYLLMLGMYDNIIPSIW